MTQCVDEFPPGSRVLLRVCPHGEAGLVTGHSRGKILVRWEDLHISARHAPESIVHVAVNSLNVASRQP